jgi:hypothetical protein
MAHLLIPPTRRETTTGFLWWKKREIEFISKISLSEQAVGCGIAMFGALVSEYAKKDKIHSITVLIVGEIKQTFDSYDAFVQESESNARVNSWLAGNRAHIFPELRNTTRRNHSQL